MMRRSKLWRSSTSKPRACRSAPCVSDLPLGARGSNPCAGDPALVPVFCVFYNDIYEGSGVIVVCYEIDGLGYWGFRGVVE